MLHPNLKYHLILKKIVMYECILKCAKLQKVTFLIIKKNLGTIKNTILVEKK